MFPGTCALNLGTVVTRFDAEEAEFKRAMIERSQRTVIALTNDKLDHDVSGWAPSKDRDVIDPNKREREVVVEADAPGAKLEGLLAGGCRTHRALAVRG